MLKQDFRRILFISLLALFSFFVNAQKINTLPIRDSNWVKSYPPFRIAGNLYYVGTYELPAYLVTTARGNILINTGLASSAALIKHNIESLGFTFSATRILLTTQAHYDHVGAMAAIKKETGAILMVDEADADVLATGGQSDYALGIHGITFKPVSADRLLHDGDTIRLGNMQLLMLHHPGHTKGSCSFLFTLHDEQRSYRVLIANMPTIVTDNHFSDISSYPNIAKDYAYTLKAMKNISFDLWLASHASQFKLHDKHKPGDAYNPMVFDDKKGYEAAIDALQKQYDEKIKKEAGN
ncbi:MAG TPA: subclass B3 metallo-beta-lactamase [Puia sp.]|nr:subclass B3 metallo-beta-lactamase [Puia sp.]